jgi:hypothetical protein
MTMKELPAVTSGVVDDRDPRVVQASQDLRLPAEAGDQLGIGVVTAQHLDRDLALEPGVMTAPDRPHAAAAEFLLNQVPLVEGRSRSDGHSPPRSSLWMTRREL